MAIGFIICGIHRAFMHTELAIKLKYYIILPCELWLQIFGWKTSNSQLNEAATKQQFFAFHLHYTLCQLKNIEQKYHQFIINTNFITPFRCVPNPFFLFLMLVAMPMHTRCDHTARRWQSVASLYFDVRMFVYTFWFWKYIHTMHPILRSCRKSGGISTMHAFNIIRHAFLFTYWIYSDDGVSICCLCRHPYFNRLEKNWIMAFF